MGFSKKSCCPRCEIKRNLPLSAGARREISWREPSFAARSHMGEISCPVRLVRLLFRRAILLPGQDARRSRTGPFGEEEDAGNEEKGR